MSYLLNKYSVVLIPDESSDYKNGYDFNFLLLKNRIKLMFALDTYLIITLSSMKMMPEYYFL